MDGEPDVGDFGLRLDRQHGLPDQITAMWTDNAGAIGGGRVHIATLGPVGRYRLLQIGSTTTGSLTLESVPAGQSLSDWQVVRTGGQIDLVPPGILQVDPEPLSLVSTKQGAGPGT